ncbi:MAG: hypothetical protein AAF901_00640 [Bacteroidota bacterium]
MKKFLIILSTLTLGCNTGKLTVVGDIPAELKEASAIELGASGDILWTIEDSGNKRRLYGIDTMARIKNDIKVLNAKNIDWEDLTSDDQGNIYIGDFGNNSKKRSKFTIYKISSDDFNLDETEAEKIKFSLPEDHKTKDFEAFFLYDEHFYVFSKEHKKFIVLKVPNIPGEHKAELISEFNLEGKNNKITAADIREDGKEVLLLNHDKLWRLTDFSGDDFFSGKIEALMFDHNSQKEGLCYKSNNEVYIVDEKSKSGGGNLYRFKLR